MTLGMIKIPKNDTIILIIYPILIHFDHLSFLKCQARPRQSIEAGREVEQFFFSTEAKSKFQLDIQLEVGPYFCLNIWMECFILWVNIYKSA